jgi:hypothetical protein
MNTRSRTAASVVAASVVAASVAPVAPVALGQVMDMPTEQLCPCGGGQSCIVDRRWVGDWVHEDNVFKDAGLPIRKNCFANFTTAQKKLLY